MDPFFLNIIMENTSLKCPSCSGQMKLAEAKPGDKIAKCEYCHTVVDLPDAAEKQQFDLNGFFQNMDMSKFKNATVTTSTIVMKNGVVVDSDGSNDDVMNIVKEALRTSRTPVTLMDDTDTVSPEDEKKEPQKIEPEKKKSLFKKWFKKE